MPEKTISSPAAEDGTKIWLDLPVQPRTDAALIVARSRNATGFGRLEGDLSAWRLPNRVVEWQPEWQDDQILARAVRELVRELDS